MIFVATSKKKTGISVCQLLFWFALCKESGSMYILSICVFWFFFFESFFFLSCRNANGLYNKNQQISFIHVDSNEVMRELM